MADLKPRLVRQRGNVRDDPGDWPEGAVVGEHPGPMPTRSLASSQCPDCHRDGTSVLGVLVCPQLLEGDARREALRVAEKGAEGDFVACGQR